MLRRILLTLVMLLVVAVAAAAVFVASRQNQKFDPPYPQVTASGDSSVIERGRYVVRDVVNCASCHGDTTQLAARMSGADVPMSGGFKWNIPPGTIYARNITADPATGLGDVSDAAIARALRSGVGHDGRALLPFMELQGLSDEDLVAVVSYLRTQAAIPNPVPAHQFNLLGKVLRATVLANPVGPRETPPVTSPRGATLENGRYLTESVALCWACHTQRSAATGELTGPRFGGATEFIEAGVSWSPPNITSDPETGRIGALSEDEFVARFRAGRLIPDSPMPWQGYARMSEDDLRAIYRYLKSVPAVKRDVGSPIAAPKPS
ncbi:MAG: cytochrome C [Candidatus Eisenbacteria bacterium]|uniref:Cytochrome C n=1 Tax=Eiseniibacteriota bacterium TaxID=2212470 RepID=A0A849SEU1_UNCEI|nr:cytochrome C [Candidatus Eisenbacteria bacterium]